MKNTNLKTFINSMEKAKTENMTIVNSTETKTTKDFVVLNNGNGYLVHTEENTVITCNCPHHTFRNAICKHMIKVSMDKGMDIKGL